jgi:hypothetical protein
VIRAVGLRARRWMLGVLPAVVVACGPTEDKAFRETRFWSDDMSFRVSLDPAPPFAREDIRVRVVVNDKESGAPIDHGEGRVYAEKISGEKTYDGLERGTEPGTYYATISYVTAGEWSMGLQFRRDSVSKLVTFDEWVQTVREER